MEGSRAMGRGFVILHVAIDGRLRKLVLELDPQDGSFVCEIDGEKLEGSANLLQPGILSLLLGGRSYRCVLDQGGEEPGIFLDGQRHSFRIEDPRLLKKRLAGAASGSGPLSIKAPMPGRVVRVLAELGAQVEANQGVLVIEAMKMQNELKAPKAGKVIELRAAPGAAVNAGEVLAIIE
jgi:acetyl/propionyl-CoA carboxylase alpha subunit